VLDGVKAGALGEHPAGKDALHVAGELDLIDFDEGGGIRRLRRRSRMAGARRHPEGAKLHRLVHRNFEMRDAPRDLVEGREYSDRILDDFGVGRRREQEADKSGEQKRRPGKTRSNQPLHVRSLSKATCTGRFAAMHSATNGAWL